ncbi:iron complex outermembrane receptor protein [Azospirillum lipoferum]|uniref:TonB-dependent receptor plug domain-containing protein n=1 Tax=Azospirillum lipoferum TaxID=193 RepID=A0A5A9GLF9_AZOLI|nr:MULTISPECIES: TonB-dependent receptor [Azospirillum]KAA0595298.1 TonB-dependent receptor plug domain-containing protein [Azospirillum lipoferum]MCP1611814.1 iron complex outermembrane receptor protein [Azospirillum lipoferum]MDW5533427.1 TonB-dependent receptor [Azospirillum sp. NL1]
MPGPAFRRESRCDRIEGAGGPARRLGAILSLSLLLVPHAAPAQTIEDLSTLSIEELGAIKVTSISKRPEPLSDAAAAVYVITAEDIRRSGATSLPEALRLAPNLEVARLNTAGYTVTARGFNSPESSNKLQVMVDGRSVYSPVASTVFWEGVNVPLSEIERIEVVSGPGGTLWGANAVNGVVNVITRSAGDSTGGFAEVGAGSGERNGTLRYGVKAADGAMALRGYLTGFDRRSSFAVTRGDASTDAFDGSQAGFRLDGKTGDGAAGGAASYTLQGDLYRNHTEWLDTTLHGGNLLGRWTHKLGDGSSVQLQAYYDQQNRDYLVATDRVQTFDVQAQHNVALGSRHQLVWGAQYRVWQSAFRSLVAFGFPDEDKTISLGSLFAQDEVTLAPKLKLTVGLKAEYNSYSGFDLLPNLRLAWRLSDAHMLWTAVSRSVRTPSRIDRELSGGGILAPSPDFQSERLTAYEVGYRGQPTANSRVALSAFYNVYDDLRTTSMTGGGLPIMLRNDMEGSTYGVEGWGSYGLTSWWTLHAGANWLHKSLRLKPGANDLSRFQAAGQDPAYQLQLRSRMNLTPEVEFDATLRRVGRVAVSNVPAYTEADLHLGWHVTPALELSLFGQNLLHARHLEAYDPSNNAPRAIGRSIYARLRVGF